MPAFVPTVIRTRKDTEACFPEFIATLTTFPKQVCCETDLQFAREVYEEQEYESFGLPPQPPLPRPPAPPSPADSRTRVTWVSTASVIKTSELTNHWGSPGASALNALYRASADQGHGHICASLPMIPDLVPCGLDLSWSMGAYLGWMHFLCPIPSVHPMTNILSLKRTKEDICENKAQEKWLVP